MLQTISVPTATVEVVSVKLTKALILQMRPINWEKVRSRFIEKSKDILGYVEGTALDSEDVHSIWVLIKYNNDWVRYKAHADTGKGLTHLFLV